MKQLGAATIVWLLGAVWASGQAGSKPVTAPGAPMAEDVFKNVQVLKGIPVDQFMGTMGFFSASLGLNCTDCHVDESGGNWAKYADDNALKRTARRMMLMVSNINTTSFGGRQVVTCNTCHRGDRRCEGIGARIGQPHREDRQTERHLDCQGPAAPSPEPRGQERDRQPVDQRRPQEFQVVGNADQAEETDCRQ